MASDNEASCEGDPNFAVICGFLEKFGTHCGLTNIDFLDLQEMIENTHEVAPELIDLHIKLLRKIRKSVSTERWERAVINICHSYNSQDAWEIERFGYKKSRIGSKLRLLKQLLEMQFDLNTKFKNEINKMSATELRTQPLGRDKTGHAYWYQTDESCQIRVYKEDQDEETWALVVKDREELVSLISQLGSGEQNSTDSVTNEDSNSLEIEKPILDTGQTTDNSDSKDSKRTSEEDEDTSEESDAMNGDKIIAVKENTTKEPRVESLSISLLKLQSKEKQSKELTEKFLQTVEEKEKLPTKEVKEKLETIEEKEKLHVKIVTEKNQTIEEKLQTKVGIEELQTNNEKELLQPKLVIDKLITNEDKLQSNKDKLQTNKDKIQTEETEKLKLNEAETKMQMHAKKIAEIAEPLINQDQVKLVEEHKISVKTFKEMETEKPSQVQSEELKNVDKPISLRLKPLTELLSQPAHDMDKRGELSGIKEKYIRSDPFSSQMSNRKAVESVGFVGLYNDLKRPINYEMDQPSILKMPRLDRPTLLGNKRFPKPYISEEHDDDDEDEEDGNESEISEEIEEPLMLVTGRGNGQDNKCENNGESPIVGDEIEEPVMYVRGSGSGKECKTGNGNNAGDNVKPDSIKKDKVEGTNCLKLGTVVDSKDNVKGEQIRVPPKNPSRDINKVSDGEDKGEEEDVSNKPSFFFGPGSVFALNKSPPNSSKTSMSFGSTASGTEQEQICDEINQNAIDSMKTTNKLGELSVCTNTIECDVIRKKVCNDKNKTLKDALNINNSGSDRRGSSKNISDKNIAGVNEFDNAKNKKIPPSRPNKEPNTLSDAKRETIKSAVVVADEPNTSLNLKNKVISVLPTSDVKNKPSKSALVDNENAKNAVSIEVNLDSNTNRDVNEPSAENSNGKKVPTKVKLNVENNVLVNSEKELKDKIENKDNIEKSNSKDETNQVEAIDIIATPLSIKNTKGDNCKPQKGTRKGRTITDKIHQVEGDSRILKDVAEKYSKTLENTRPQKDLKTVEDETATKGGCKPPILLRGTRRSRPNTANVNIVEQAALKPVSDTSLEQTSKTHENDLSLKEAKPQKPLNLRARNRSNADKVASESHFPNAIISNRLEGESSIAMGAPNTIAEKEVLKQPLGNLKNSPTLFLKDAKGGDCTKQTDPKNLNLMPIAKGKSHKVLLKGTRRGRSNFGIMDKTIAVERAKSVPDISSMSKDDPNLKPPENETTLKKITKGTNDKPKTDVVGGGKPKTVSGGKSKSNLAEGVKSKTDVIEGSNLKTVVEDESAVSIVEKNVELRVNELKGVSKPPKAISLRGTRRSRRNQNTGNERSVDMDKIEREIEKDTLKDELETTKSKTIAQSLTVKRNNEGEIEEQVCRRKKISPCGDETREENPEDRKNENMEKAVEKALKMGVEKTLKPASEKLNQKHVKPKIEKPNEKNIKSEVKEVMIKKLKEDALKSELKHVVVEQPKQLENVVVEKPKQLENVVVEKPKQLENVVVEKPQEKAALISEIEKPTEETLKSETEEMVVEKTGNNILNSKLSPKKFSNSELPEVEIEGVKEKNEMEDVKFEIAKLKEKYSTLKVTEIDIVKPTEKCSKSEVKEVESEAIKSEINKLETEKISEMKDEEVEKTSQAEIKDIKATDEKPLTIATLSLDYTETNAEEIQKVMRRVTRKRGRSSPVDENIEEGNEKRRKMKGKRGMDVDLRRSIEEKKLEISSSDEEKNAKKIEPESGEIVKKSKKSKKRRTMLGLDIPEDMSSVDIPLGVRQSRRIAQNKIKEEAERRKIEELTTVHDVKVAYKKKSKKEDDKDYKAEKRKRIKMVITDDETTNDVESDDKKKKKKKQKRKNPKFDESKPWLSSSDSSSESKEDEEEEEVEYDDDVGSPLFKSDHEFSPESDLESSDEIQPLKRARTVRKEDAVEEEIDDTNCQKCDKSDHPEWILLCDGCDSGWHCSCLRPALLVIPEGDWYCPPCQHLTLVKSLQEKLIDFDKRVSKREIEVRRKERLAYVGISLDHVLPSKDHDDHKSKHKQRKSDDSDDSDSRDSSSRRSRSSSSSSGTDSEDEPIYQLRQRKQAHSYRFNDYDDLINSAIQEEIATVSSTTIPSHGKDIANIVNNEEPQLPPVVPANTDLPPVLATQPDGSDDDIIRPVQKLIGKKKHRKLNSLDVSSEDDNDDEDFKGSSSGVDEEDLDDEYGSESSDSDTRRGKRRGPVRRSTRARTSRYDKDFIDDDSEDEAPRKKKRSIWDETESEESDRSWGRRKRRSNPRKPVSSSISKKKKSKKKKSRDDSDPEVYKKKKPRIKFGGLDTDEEDGEGDRRRTRGKKINYLDVLGTDSDDDGRRRNAVRDEESEDEFILNEEEDVPDDGIERDSDDSNDDPHLVAGVMRSNKKGLGKGGIKRIKRAQGEEEELFPPLEPAQPQPEKVVAVVLPPPMDNELMNEPNPIEQMNKNIEAMDEKEMEMMMEEEEYANRQLQMVAEQLEKEKRRKEMEARRLEAAIPTTVMVQQPLPLTVNLAQSIPTVATGEKSPKKRGRKPKSAQISPENPAVFNLAQSVDKVDSGEFGDGTPMIFNPDGTPKKRRGRGKGKKTLEKEAAAAAAAAGGTIPASDGGDSDVPSTIELSSKGSSDAILGGKLGVAAAPQPFAQSQPKPSVITRMLQSQPGQPSFPVGAMGQHKFFADGPRGPSPPISGQPSAPSYIPGSAPGPGAGPRGIPTGPGQFRPILNHYPQPRAGAPPQNRHPSPGPQNIPPHIFHGHHPMDPSPSGGGQLPPSDRSSPSLVSPSSASPLSTKGDPTPPPPPYVRPPMVRFPPGTAGTAGPRHPGLLLPPHLQQPRPPFHPGMNPNYYGPYPSPEDGSPGSQFSNAAPYPEQFPPEAPTPEVQRNYDEENGEFGGLVSYFSSQREDDLDT